VAKKLYFGGLSYNTTDDSLNAAVASHGTVVSAKVIMDRETGRSRGFGFVEMSTDDEADAVLKALDGQEIDGRMVRVSVARPPENGGGGGGGRGGGFGGGRGGGGGGFGGGDRRQSW
jgi:RNA recognition motif-containing protein